MDVKKIVVAVEDVDAARTALQWALRNIIRYGDIITLLHVYNHSTRSRSRSKARLLRLNGFKLALSFQDMCNSYPNVRTLFQFVFVLFQLLLRCGFCRVQINGYVSYIIIGLCYRQRLKLLSRKGTKKEPRSQPRCERLELPCLWLDSMIIVFYTSKSNLKTFPCFEFNFKR